jgi:hypothetical protein
MESQSGGNVESVLRLYREWQEALAVAPTSDYASDLMSALYRVLRLAPGFDHPNLEQLHIEAYPIPAERPARLVPADLLLEACVVS